MFIHLMNLLSHPRCFRAPLLQPIHQLFYKRMTSQLPGLCSIAILSSTVQRIVRYFKMIFPEIISRLLKHEFQCRWIYDFIGDFDLTNEDYFFLHECPNITLLTGTPRTNIQRSFLTVVKACIFICFIYVHI